VYGNLTVEAQPVLLSLVPGEPGANRATTTIRLEAASNAAPGFRVLLLEEEPDAVTARPTPAWRAFGARAPQRDAPQRDAPRPKSTARVLELTAGAPSASSERGPPRRQELEQGDVVLVDSPVTWPVESPLELLVELTVEADFAVDAGTHVSELRFVLVPRLA